MAAGLRREELAAMRCAAHSDLSLAPASTLRLLDYVAELEAALAMRAGRIRDAEEAGALPVEEVAR